MRAFAHPTLQVSDLKQLRVARLDLLARLFNSGGIVLPGLDVVELACTGLLPHLRVDGMLAGEIDEKLLGFQRMQPVLEQPRGIRVGR